MKKILVLLTFFLLSSTVWAKPITQLIFFGDSLTDDGNFYLMLSRQIPAFPPYYNGRFSNGLTWAEHVGKAAYEQADIGFRNFAFGSATATNTNPIAELTLQGEVTRYLNDGAVATIDSSLFFVWIGGNDYLNEHQMEPELLTDNVMTAIDAQLTRLIDAGAQHFVLINLPDFTKGPIGKNNPGEVERLKKLIALHNKKLNLLIANVKSKAAHLTVTGVNINEFWDDFLNHIDDYNHKYGTHITNTKDACFNPFMTGNEKLLIADPKLSKNARILLRSSKELAFTVPNKMNVSIFHCEKPSEYVFWDIIHPTEVAHKVIGRVVLENISQIFV